jgi:hypothetical protein
MMDGVYFGDFIKVEDMSEEDKAKHPKGMIVRKKCCECDTIAQRYCEVCGKLLCLTHYTVVPDEISYKITCEKCKKIIKGIMKNNKTYQEALAIHKREEKNEQK